MWLEWTLLLSFYSAIVTICLCLWIALRKPKRIHGLSSYKTMVVLGSGGHTSEMFRFLNTLPVNRKHVPRVYVVANNDTGSVSTMQEFEGTKSHNRQDYTVRYIPRSRVVGQSYFTSIFTTLYSLLHAARLVYVEKPHVLLANGPGTCLPVLFCTWLYRTIDRYCVQWPNLLNAAQKHIIYTGRIPMERFNSNFDPSTLKSIGEPCLSYVLVTVGSTLFQSLIHAIDKPEFISMLKKQGFSGLHVQYGKGVPPKNLQSKPGFEVVLYDYKKIGWKAEMADAGLVIGHAGAGTILDSLEASKAIIVVANDLLMSQHQTEIANAMQQLGHLFQSTPQSLMKDLPHLLQNLQNLKCFPKAETSVFATELSKLLAAGKTPVFPKRSVTHTKSLRITKSES